MRLALFFTTGISIEKWHSDGNLQRELALYRLLSSYFEKIFLFTYGTESDLKFQAELPENMIIQYKRWPIPNKLYSFLLPFFYHRILRTIDIYKTNQMSGSWTAVIAKLLYRKNLIIRCGYELLFFLEKQCAPRWKRGLTILAEYIAYSAADTIIVASHADQLFIEKRFYHKEKIICLPNYVDTNTFKPLPTVKNKKQIIFIGRFTEQKNLFNLLDACIGLDLTLVFIGRGELEKKLRERALYLKINSEFKGNLPNEKLPEELNRSALFVLPSFYEGSPKTLLEAMACGMPCIGTDVEGINTIIRHKENGYLCNTDSASLHQAILDLFQNETLCNAIGEVARKTIEEKYSLTQYAEKEQALYKSLCRS